MASQPVPDRPLIALVGAYLLWALLFSLYGGGQCLFLALALALLLLRPGEAPAIEAQKPLWEQSSSRGSA